MNVRPASTEDIPDMHRVRMSVVENALSDPASVQPEHYRTMLLERGRGWVAEVDGRIVGFAVADLSRSNVWALFVEPAHEGRGLGRTLHSAMLDWMFQSGTELVWLSTTPGTRADRFYRAAQWVCTGAHGPDEVRFELSRAAWESQRRD